MTIQWFPGHMNKARKDVESKLKLVDIVFVLLDARAPLSSSNPMLNNIIKNKPTLYLLNKSNMADQSKTNQFIEYYKKQGITALDIDSISGKNINKIVPTSQDILKNILEKRMNKGLKPRALRAMIIGIPNVGKSTLINKLTSRKATNTGDRPGVTKNQQWIRLNKDLELLDTPGILWPKFEDQRVGYVLSLLGSIKQAILPLDDIVIFGIKYFLENYKSNLYERYNIEKDYEDIISILDHIGTNRGCLKKGGLIDYQKVYDIFLNDLFSLYLGRVTYDEI